MAALTELITLVATSTNQAMPFLSASRTDEFLRPTSLLKRCLALLFCAVELHELRKGHLCLKLDAVGSRDRHWYLRTTFVAK